MLSSLLEPDCLARVLDADRADHPQHHLPEPGTLSAARRVVATWGPNRAERVLLDAAAATDGLKVLLDTIRYARQLGSHGPATLPNRLAALHDVHRTRVATAPPPRPRPEPPPPAAGRAGPTPDLVPRVPTGPPRPQHRIFAPPTVLRVVVAATVLPARPEVQALDGRTFGEPTVHSATFVVPRTAGDLVRWGRLLSNCLGDFGPAVAAGRSTIVGIEQGNALAFAVEVDTDGRIRQFAGRANRAPTDALREATVAALRAAGIVTRA